jgi:flagellar hook-associated protein FlgK
MSYKEFNKFELLGKTSQEGQKFIDKLSGMGYGGVADLNDRTMNYYHTKATVMFNNSNLKNFKVSQITNNEYTKAKVKAYLMGGADVLSHPISVATGVGVGGALALRKYDKQTKRRNKKK